MINTCENLTSLITKTWNIFTKSLETKLSEIRKSKVEYYTEYFNKNKSNMKMPWKGIRSIVDVKYKAGSTISHLIGADNAKVDDSKKWLIFLTTFLLILQKNQ